MVKEFILGLMEDNTPDRMLMIRNKEKVYINGRTENVMTAIGYKESNMEKPISRRRPENKKEDYGKMVKGLNGLILTMNNE